MKIEQLTITTGRNWKVIEVTDQTNECLKIKEVIGQTATGRKSLALPVRKRVVKSRREREERHGHQ